MRKYPGQVCILACACMHILHVNIYIIAVCFASDACVHLHVHVCLRLHIFSVDVAARFMH
jgi:hypothetical protein